MNDKEFGQRVRQLREKAQFTREEFCMDESELSVRQLTRIESGTCKPTFSKINFIANRLGLGLYELMPDYVKLPERYSKLKFDMLRTPTYGDESLVEKRDQLISEVYDTYYADLPEEEQIAVDAFRSTIDTFETKSNAYGKEIIDDYFDQILHKTRYTINDLLIIRLYLEHLRADDGTSINFKKFLELVEHLPGQVDIMDANELFILRDVMLVTIGELGRTKQFATIPSLFQALDQVMIITQDFQKKPILNLLKWKYELYVNDDYEAAKLLFEEAIMFANLIGHQYLVDKLNADWVEDNA